MKKNLRKLFLSGILSVLVIAGLLVSVKSMAGGNQQSANGHGTLNNPDGSKRQFSFNAQRKANGVVSGQAILHNPAFNGDNGNNYYLQVDITCMKVYGNLAVMSGTTRRTNDSNLVDVATFSVQDFGEPGKDNDKISRVFFFDDDPNTMGDPQVCENTPITGPEALPLETIAAGNIQVKP